MRRLSLLALVLNGLAPAPAAPPAADLTQLSPEELFGTEVTSVGRKAQSVASAPAAVYVITREEIRRSGSTTIMEALRLAPGLTVLQVSAQQWAISARGAASAWANRLQVLVDGRSVYLPIFSGVLWDTQMMPLEEIDRIEVIRGPGATMWGANAVNGVINIITRSSRSEEGGQVSLSTGNRLPLSATFRWSQSQGEKVSWRGWGRLTRHVLRREGDTLIFNGWGASVEPVRARDSSGNFGLGGVRVDIDATGRDQITIQAGTHYGRLNETYRYITETGPYYKDEPTDSLRAGAHVLARWQRSVNERRDWDWTTYLITDRIGIMGGDSRQHTFDSNLQHRWQTSARNEVYAGAGIRQYWDRGPVAEGFRFDPERGRMSSAAAVVRDEYQVVPGKWLVSLALRQEYHSMSKWNWQPSARLMWTPHRRHSAWAAVSRAVRTPSRADRDVQMTSAIFEQQGWLVKAELIPNPNYRNEAFVSYEAGWRTQHGKRWLADAALFYSRGSRLRVYELSSVGWAEVASRPALLLQTQTRNGGRINSAGGELFAQWQAASWCRLFGAYSLLASQVKQWPEVSLSPATADPRNQGQVRLSLDFTRRLSWEVRAFATGRIDTYRIPGHVRLDTSLVWRPDRQNQFTLAVSNLSGRRQIEMMGEGPVPASAMGRTVVLRWTRGL